MSDTESPVPTHPPSNPDKSVEKDGYRAQFYPGFVRRLAVRGPDGDVELYDQGGEPFILPPGDTDPWPSSTLEFVRPDGRRVLLQIDDPDRQIGRIEVYLKGDGAMTDGSGELLLICEDGPILCPPTCPEPPGGGG